MDRTITGDGSRGSAGLRVKFGALLHSLLHPFDGFYECRHRGLKSNLLTAIGIIAYGLVATLKYQYTGFIINFNPIHYMNSVTIFISATSIFILFAIGNWTITTLFNGKGFLSDILMVLGYALYPVVAMELIVLVMSNFVIMEEVMLIRALAGLAWAWFAFLVVAGLATIHEYGLGRTLVTIAATAVSMAILVFIFILYITLMQQLISFVTSLIQEVIRRV